MRTELSSLPLAAPVAAADEDEEVGLMSSRGTMSIRKSN